jgi:hypothetical protein
LVKRPRKIKEQYCYQQKTNNSKRNSNLS